MDIAMKLSLRLAFQTLSLFVLSASLLLAGNAEQARRNGTQPPRYRAGTLILKLKSTTPNIRGPRRFGVETIDLLLDRAGMTSRRSLFPLAPYPENHTASTPSDDPLMRGFDRIYVVDYSAPTDARALAAELNATGMVEFAEPYFIFETNYTPNDPMLTQQAWIELIKARQAWDVTKGDTSIAIAIIDTGIEWLHDDLAPNIWINPGETGTDPQGNDKRSNGRDDDANGFVDDYHGWDFVGNVSISQIQSGSLRPDNNPAPTVVSTPGYQGYHGTVVGGCASARADNGKGIAGTGFLTRLIPVKCAADTVGTGSVVAGYDGIRYAADAGARVINCSWGGPLDAGSVSGIQSVVNYAHSKGALVVAAAGNNGTNNDLAPQYPANLRHVLSVGATDERDSVSGFSQYGISVGVWAPGVSVFTTVPGNAYSASVGGGAINGTSFSSPIVAGIAALVMARHPDWTPEQVAMQLRVTGDRVKVRSADLGPYFFRRANAYRAVALNNTLAEGDPTGLPGVALEGYTVNGRATDTIRDVNQSVDVRISLKNYLAPASDLRVEALPNQALTIDAPITIASLGSLETTTRDMAVRLKPNSGTIYSEGNLQLVLKITGGPYEDYVAIQIPVRLPGWHLQSDQFAGNLPVYSGSGIHAVTPKIAWTLTNATVSQSSQVALYSRVTDGANWSRYQQVPGQEALYCITARDERRAWAGSGPSSAQAKIFRTTNGGAAWLTTNVSQITPFVNAVHMFDDQNGIFIGDPRSSRWGIGVTTDAGATWSAITQPLTAGNSSEAGWNNSFAANGDNLWFGTNNSRIYRSTDRGRTWAFTSTPSVNCFFLAFANASDGIATFAPGSNGAGTYMICVTRDGGKSWRQVSPPFSGTQATGVSFVPGTTRAFVATQNGVYETSDFGVTWKQMAVPPILFVAVTMSTAADGSGALASYATNAYSQLMNYAETKPLAVPDEVDRAGRNVRLLQNLPNPCASATTIPFVLGRPAHVTLLLHDALGYEARRVTIGTLAAGSHDVVLPVDGLPSGAYYYTLKAGDDQQTRRLVIAR